MARKSIQRVNAIDIDTNSIVECDQGDAVQIRVVPTVSNPYGGDGIPCIPATARLIGASVLWPTKLIKIEPAEGSRRRPWPFVRFETEPFARYEGDTAPITKSGCFVRNEQDAKDRLFHKLTEVERERIMKAVQVQS